MTITEIKNELKEFAKFPDGWYGGGEGRGTLPDVYIFSLQLLDKFISHNILNKFIISVHPGIDGGILYALYNDKYFMEIIIECNLGITMYIDKKDESNDITKEECIFEGDEMNINNVIKQLELI